ncbi:hypothetical protein [Pseudomonas rhodesiae]|uniref:hypothetical protein n=1 Tax=Pseudomonas rhodesiae TaxID=76760 RepID=UPI001F237F5E|nr:hypothetical protein [Pseudomonas rhodesiae]
MNKVVCTDCLTEEYLRALASDNDVNQCDYCDQELPVMDMEELMERCETAIHSK